MEQNVKHQRNLSESDDAIRRSSSSFTDFTDNHQDDKSPQYQSMLALTKHISEDSHTNTLTKMAPTT